ncbi:FeoA family protein [Sporomusa sp.]|uniref:FeoA family protein n=1 Tax=Sporomusa sp. TaxID=2078658 RepID=UPI002BE98693|nr:FeoA family protein [Sporomusa sp.]HWR05358.1 FeoA family protein [Sporomusa sp.]
MIEESVIMLRAGETARIIAISSLDYSNMKKLTVFGLLPGVEIEVVQTTPVYVIRIDNTELALDRETAAGILVTKSLPGRRK